MVARGKAYHLVLFFFINLLVITPKSACGQYDQLHFFDLQIDGLPFSHQVNTLFQDSYGFLWIGTNTGLYQYDGNRLKAFQYDVFEPTSIPNNSINSIIEDDLQNLWLGSESYLIRFNRREETFDYFYKNQTSVCLGKGTDGTIWANLRKVGLVKIESTDRVEDLVFETHFNYSREGIIRENRLLHALCEDKFGRTWVGTPTGLYYLDADHKLQLTNFTEPITALLPGNNQTLWASTRYGVYRLEYAQNNTFLATLDHYPIFLKNAGGNQRIRSLLVDQREQVWVGTSEGLFRGMPVLNNYRFDKVKDDEAFHGVHKDQINSLIQDQFGNIWIGYNKGVKKLVSRSSVFQFNALERLDASLKNQKVICQQLDRNDQLWFGLNQGGLYRLDLNTRELKLVINSPGRVNAIRYNFEQNGFLIGIGPELYEVTALPAEQPVIRLVTRYDQAIQDIVPISAQEIWLGLWGGGLRILNPEGALTGYRPQLLAESLGNNVSVMLKDSKRNVWIGTRGNGLYRVDLKNRTYEHYQPSKDSGLSSNAFLSIHEDSDQQIWMGTRGGGLIRYHEVKNSFSAFSRQHGLISNTITGIEEDNRNHLWLSTTSGLVQFHKNKHQVLNFTAEDGILNSQFAFNSSSATADGNVLFFGTSDGYYAVYPEAFQRMQVLPQTVITSFNILDHHTDQASSFREQVGEMISDSSSITLPYYQNDFSLEFSSLDLTAPAKNQFAYMLEGVNDNWINAGRNIRNASYYDLSHGQYTFRVKSTNSDGVWNNRATVLRINITPPFWLTWWAYTFYALLIGAIITALVIATRKWYQLKKNLLKETVSREKDNEYHRMRMVFFTDISHELRTPLTLIISSIEQLLKGKVPDAGRAVPQRIYHHALKMKQLINQIMDIRKYSEGEFRLKVSQRDAVPYLQMLTSTFTDHARSQQIDLTFQAEAPHLMACFDPFIVEKIVSNLLSNALKFTAAAGKIQLTVNRIKLSADHLTDMTSRPGYFLEITVEDNGIGIAPEDLGHIFNRYYQASNHLKANASGSTGIGMELVHKLVRLHHGRITVASELNTYTRFTVHLPLAADQYPAEVQTSTSEVVTVGPIIGSAAQLNGGEKVPVPRPVTHREQLVSPYPEKPRVLLVEDNPDLRHMMREILEKHYTILEAENGKIGFDQAVNEQPQIIISDVLMPEVDGIGLLKKLKGESKTRHIPVFLLTAKVNDEVKRESIQLGAEDFIEKPFSMDFLEWKVANALKTRKILEEKYSKKITAAPSEIELESPDEKLVQDLVQLIEDHLNDPRLSVEFLAGQVGMSRANLYRKVQKILGETPVSFIRKLKLERARQILSMNKFYVSEVAYMCGFKSQRYFSKCFVKAFGYTPTQFAAQQEEVPLDQE